MTGYPLLRDGHLERLFGRDLTRGGWVVDIPAPANDDAMMELIDPALFWPRKPRDGR
jgi:hypothetical protein